MFGGSNSIIRFSSHLEQYNQNIGNSYLTQSFQEQRQIDNFIRSTKLLKIVETAAEYFVRNLQESKRPEDSFNAIVIKFPFVYSETFSQSLELIHYAIEEPVQFANTLKYCVYSLLRDILNKTTRTSDCSHLTNIDIDQVHVLIRFLNLPFQKDLCFQPYLNSYRTGISEVIGILSAFTVPDKVVIQSVWYCSTDCTRNKIKTNLLDVPTCTNCKHPMNEYTKLRYSQNYYLLRILPVESVEPPRNLNKIFRAVTVRAPEHVFDCQLTLGDRYIVTGYYNYSSQKEEFEAWNLSTI